MDVSAYYTFIPHLRKGIAKQYPEKSVVTSLEGVPVSVNLALNNNTITEVPDARLIGPGEILGFDDSIVVRRGPTINESNFSPTFLSFIDFFHEDLPWRFTPYEPVLPPTDPDYMSEQLQPWITLIVLAEDEFEFITVDTAVAGAFKLNSTDLLSVFPKPSTLWAWAHVQVNADVTDSGNPIATRSSTTTTNDVLKDILTNSPDKIVSRLVCPRKLKTNKTYHAFVIPTFERGRQAGLNTDASQITAMAVDPAWDVDNQVLPQEFPYYLTWSFSTGDYGDFESLARKIVPGVPSPRLGVMGLDMRSPNHPWFDDNTLQIVTGDVTGYLDIPGYLEMEGIIRKPASTASDTPDTPADMEDDFRDLINLADDNVQDMTGTAAQQDPILTIPFYGQWYAQKTRLENSTLANAQWLNRMNTDPRYRLVAGIGSDVVRRNVRKFLQQAWDQASGPDNAGGYQNANSTLKKLQSSYAFLDRYYQKHYSSLPTGEYFQVLTRQLGRVLYTCNCTKTRDYPIPYTEIAVPLPTIDPIQPVIEFAGANFIATGTSTLTVNWTINISGPLTAFQFSYIEDVNGNSSAPLPQPVSAGMSTVTITRTYPVDTSPYLVHLYLQSGAGYSIQHIDTAAAAITIPNIADEGPHIATIRECVSCSPVPVKVLDPSFRSLLRRNSTLMRNMQYYESTISDLVNDLNSGSVTAVRSYSNPVQITTPIPSPSGFADTDFVLTYPDYAANTPPDNSQWSAITYSSGSQYRITAKAITGILNAADFITSRYYPDETNNGVNLDDLKTALQTAVDPYTTLKAKAAATVQVNDAPVTDAVDDFNFDLIKTAPVFDNPMIYPLLALDDQFFCPNIEDVADNSMTLMEVNHPFIEAYMVGMNHEMTRRLLWSEYPTDLRTTYFRTFFDSNTLPPAKDEVIDTTRASELEQARDITPIHTWLETDMLGDHSPRQTADLVLVIRAELLRKFPNLYIYAQQGVWDTTTQNRHLDDTKDKIEPVYFASVSPDVILLGFPILRSDAEGTSTYSTAANSGGYYFVFQERAGDTRFGFAMPENTNPGVDVFYADSNHWEDINWGHIAQGNDKVSTFEVIDADQIPEISTPSWTGSISEVGQGGSTTLQSVYWNQNSNAADMAYILYDKPVKVAVHASVMLNPA
jgi:hypothetical protein